MATFIEKSDSLFNGQIKNFANKLPLYGTALGLTAAEIASVKADSLAVDYVFGNQLTVQTYGQNYTTFKNTLRKGGDQTLGALPAAPVFAAAPPMVAINVEARFRALLQRITHQPGYTTAMGEDLGIEAPAENFAPMSGKPLFTIEPSSGGYPNLRWTKGKYQGVEIWKDSGQGFVKLDRDMKPDYIDKSNLPAVGTSAMWKYKMIYLLNDEISGNWSDVVAVTVHGEV